MKGKKQDGVLTAIEVMEEKAEENEVVELENEEEEDNETVEKKTNKTRTNRNAKRYTKRENDVIFEAVNNFAEQNNVKISDLIRTLRVMSSKTNRNDNNNGFNDFDGQDIGDAVVRTKHKHYPIWSHLKTLLPHRSLLSLYNRADRMFQRLHTTSTPWTDQEKETLLFYVEKYGFRWSHIGRLMGRFDDDCHQMYRVTVRARVKVGQFTLDEDVALLRIIQRLTNNHGTNIADIPVSNLPWERITEFLNFQRLPIDYLRHWGILRHALLMGFHSQSRSHSSQNSFEEEKEGGGEIKSAREVLKKRNKKKNTSFALLAFQSAKSLVILEKLFKIWKEEDIDDELDIIWQDVDTNLGLGYGESRRKWKLYCKECPASLGTFEGKLLHLVKKYKMDKEFPTVIVNSQETENEAPKVEEMTEEEKKEFEEKEEKKRKLKKSIKKEVKKLKRIEKAVLDSKTKVYDYEDCSSVNDEELLMDEEQSEYDDEESKKRSFDEIARDIFGDDSDGENENKRLQTELETSKSKTEKKKKVTKNK